MAEHQVDVSIYIHANHPAEAHHRLGNLLNVCVEQGALARWRFTPVPETLDGGDEVTSADLEARARTMAAELKTEGVTLGLDDLTVDAVAGALSVLANKLSTLEQKAKRRQRR